MMHLSREKCHSQLRLRVRSAIHLARHEAGRRRTLRSPIVEGSILNNMVDRPESSTRANAHQIGVSHQTVYRILKEYRFQPFHLL